MQEGPPICSDFEVRGRPYIGTSTLDALSSHIAANAALVRPGFVVLDPFCGTGSLLLSSAFLGADVVGADIDADCLGLVDLTNSTYKSRSKNARFKRRNKVNGLEWNQLNGSIIMNFEYYGLERKVLSLIACSVEAWSQLPSTGTPTVNEFPLFDAIVTDPPFGRRERVFSSEQVNAELISSELSGFHNDSKYAIVMLFIVAMKRLKHGGKLVFWLPTEAFLTRQEVELMLETYKSSAISISNAYADPGVGKKLIFENAKQQELNYGVWRWLVRYRSVCS